MTDPVLTRSLQRIVILGLYGIRIESGEVTIYGAIFKPSKDIHWVYAPQSHALPVVRCTDDATLELHPHPRAQEMKSIGMLSPLFRKLWWESPSSPVKDKAASFNESFCIVSPHVLSSDCQVLIFESFILQRMGLRGLPFKT